MSYEEMTASSLKITLLTTVYLRSFLGCEDDPLQASSIYIRMFAHIHIPVSIYIQYTREHTHTQTHTYTHTHTNTHTHTHKMMSDLMPKLQRINIVDPSILHDEMLFFEIMNLKNIGK